MTCCACVLRARSSSMRSFTSFVGATGRTDRALLNLAQPQTQVVDRCLVHRCPCRGDTCGIQSDSAISLTPTPAWPNALNCTMTDCSRIVID